MFNSVDLKLIRFDIYFYFVYLMKWFNCWNNLIVELNKFEFIIFTTIHDSIHLTLPISMICMKQKILWLYVYDLFASVYNRVQKSSIYLVLICIDCRILPIVKKQLLIYLFHALVFVCNYLRILIYNKLLVDNSIFL